MPFLWLDEGEDAQLEGTFATASPSKDYPDGTLGIWVYTIPTRGTFADSYKLAPMYLDEYAD